MNGFVAMKAELNKGSESFEIGKVDKVFKGLDVVTKVEAPLLDLYNSNNVYTVKYASPKLFVHEKAVSPWKGVVSTDPIIVIFQKLDNKRTLSHAVQRQLQTKFPSRF